MIKRDNNSISEIDYDIDKEIEKVAKKKTKYNDIYLVATFLILLGIMISLITINNINKDDNNYSDILNINTKEDSLTIVNDGIINERIDSSKFNKNKKYTIEKIDSIEIKKKNENSKIFYNVVYEISENKFPVNVISKADSNVVVRFSYSYDKKEWKYINNVISYKETAIAPISGKHYDISGLTGILKVITDRELNVNKIYWRSETIFQGEDINEQYTANFRLEFSKISR